MKPAEHVPAGAVRPGTSQYMVAVQGEHCDTRERRGDAENVPRGHLLAAASEPVPAKHTYPAGQSAGYVLFAPQMRPAGQVVQNACPVWLLYEPGAQPMGAAEPCGQYIATGQIVCVGVDEPPLQNQPAAQGPVPAGVVKLALAQ